MREKKKLRNSKLPKTSIIVAIILVAIILIAIGIYGIYSKKNTENPKEEPNNNHNDNSEIKQELQVTGKLAEFIKALGDNYSIKYYGNFIGNDGKPITAVVEYTKDGSEFAIKSTELEMHLIYDSNKLHSISNRYNIIVKISKESFDISEYNLVSDIGQTFVNSYKERIGSKEYDVEEYTYNENTLKYYFIGNDIKFVRYKSEEIQVIRVEKITNSYLFEKPVGYSEI